MPLVERRIHRLALCVLVVASGVTARAQGEIGETEAMSYDFLLAISEPEDLDAVDEYSAAGFAPEAMNRYAEALARPAARPATVARAVSLGASAYTVAVRRSGGGSEAEVLEEIASSHIAAIAPPEGLPLVDLVGGATMYRLLGDDAAAAMWYARLVETSDDPINYFFYARALRALGHDRLADEYTTRYAKARRK